MKAALIFTGSGPIVILTTHETLTDPDLVARLAAKGIRKFLAFEVPVERSGEVPRALRARAGGHQAGGRPGVVDEDGHRIYAAFSSGARPAIAWEP